VRPPRPIDVKKLMEKRVFLGLSRGNSPRKCSAMVGSCRRAFSLRSPRNSAIVWKRNLMKIRELLVVSACKAGRR